MVWAQPPNDECAGAINLPLGTPPACPAGGAVTNTFNFTNVNATPTSPYPTFSNCVIGGQTSSPADEVWFTFTPNSNLLQITLSGGLNTPNIVIFQGTNCQFLTAIQCARGSTSPLTINLALIPGQQYYMLVSGGGIGDQSNFTLTMISSRDCNPCLQSTTFVAFPPPLNGTYNSGQTVNFCFSVTGWDVTTTIEWLHAVTIDFGPGWNLSSLVTTPPPSCGGDGSWGWYNSWVSCNTGQTFGPGFAYDSSSGLGCGGTPNDGNPGNNWGDGVGPCASIGDGTPASVTFCWSIQVANCPPNSTGNDLSMNVRVWSDGDSGSWNITGCNSGNQYNFLASAVCCDDGNPVAIPTPTRCPQVSDGTITMEGSAMDKPYNYYVFNSMGQLVFQILGVIGPVTASNLPAGQYSVLAVNVQSGCQRSRAVTISAGTPPQAIATNGGPYCPGDPVSLFGNYTFSSPAINVTYQWSGPGGFSSTAQNPTNATQAGTYTLVVNVDGCTSAPVNTNVVFQPAFANVTATPATVCPGAPSTLTATGASSYVWSTGQTGNSITVNPNQTTTYSVTATNSFGCTTVRDITVNTHPVPNLSIDGPPTGCAGAVVPLFAVGGPFSQYLWSNGQTGTPAAVDLASPQSVFSVTATTAQGCQTVASTTIVVFPNPIATASASPATVCAGQTTTLTASGGSTYLWSNNATTASISVAPGATTAYQVTVTAVDGCSSTASVTVNVVQPIAAPVISCGNATPNSVSFSWPPIPNATGYNVNVLSGQTGALNGTTYTVSGLAPGTPVTIQVTASTGTVCPSTTATFTCSSLSCPPIDVAIQSPGAFCFGSGNTPVTLTANITGGSGMGARSWSGPGIINSGTGIFHADTAGVGNHSIVLTYTEGPCSYSDTITVDVHAVPTSTFTAAPTPICTSDSTLVTYSGSATANATYTWNFGGGSATPGTGQGPHSIVWNTPGSKTISLTVAENGCTSAQSSQNVQVDAPLPAPVINCATTTSDILFAWTDVPGASGYTVTVISGPTGVQNGNTYTVSGLMPGDSVRIRVTALNSGPCGPSEAELTCFAQACPPVNITLAPVAPVCLTPNTAVIALSATVGGGAGGGNSAWSGPGVAPGAAVFNPNVAGVGTHTINFTYTESTCVYNSSMTIVVHAQPSSTFTAVSPICVNNTSLAIYTGNAGSSANFNWNFDGGTATPGTGQGPHTISWASPGNKTLSLTVTENGCISPASTQPVQVDAALAPPVISCSASTTTSVTFSWTPVPGANNYAVNVLSGQTGALSGTTFTVSGLMPQEQVQIQVTAQGNTVCGPSTSTFTCAAAACPIFNISIAAVPDICLTAGTPPIVMQATVNGASAGVGVWSGAGITNAATGTFSPLVAGPGQHTITYTYTEGPCSASSTRLINVFATPSSSFTVSPGAVCTGQAVSATFTGSAGAGATFNWNFDGGTALPGTGAGPHNISWAGPGTRNIALTVIENGCTSPVSTQTVMVEAPLATPVINCSTTPSQITFTWANVPGATGYQVTLLSGPAGIQSGNTYTVSGLMPGDAVSIRVTALNPGPCGPSSAEQSCVAQNCPPVTIALNGVEPICLTPNVLPITLGASVTGGAGGGTSVWSGPGITNGNTGQFNPSVAGPGTHTIAYQYQEGTCAYNSSITITVNAQPVATFSAPTAICLNDNATLVFTGSAPPGATYSWGFDGGTASPGAGVGPHTVSWTSAGVRNVTLTVTSNNCPSAPFSRSIQVDAPLAPPQITCTSTSNSITFSWQPVPGATGYQAISTSGPQGTLSGTTYALTNLSPNQSVSIEVTALGSGACGNSTATATCLAQNCPTLTLVISGTTTICSGQPAQVVFDFAGSSQGPFTVVYSINGGAPVTGVFTDGQSIPIQALNTTTVNAVSITDNSLPDCVYPSNASWTIFVAQPVSAGVPSPPARLCAGENRTVTLSSLLTGASPGGAWTESSASPSTGMAFNANTGTFNAVGQQAGLYTFIYNVPGPVPCPSSQATVSVILEPSPVADAGIDRTLTCNTTTLSIGGAGTSTGTGITYMWSSTTPGVVIANPNARMIEVSQPGIYRLTVSNDIGCTSTDEVMVSANFNTPVAAIEISPITCYQYNDGAIRISSITGGSPPYALSLDGSTYSTQLFFAGLGAGQHVLTVRDANGCLASLTFVLDEPEQLIVNIETSAGNQGNLIELGDSVRLEAVVSGGAPIDSIWWKPDSVSRNAASIWVIPRNATTYSVTVIDRNGCRAEDRVTIFVERNRRVFIPNAFSPDDDGVNDIFSIYAAPDQVRQVRKFMVFNRWGEPMFELNNFQPNNPVIGWNGEHRGKLMNAGVYVYFAEVEFFDGEVIIYKGDVLLMR